MARDVIQGKMKDAYLLAAMAALANKYPQMITRLFVLIDNPYHIYGVRLFIEGKWQTISLDLKFPIHKTANETRNFCGSQPIEIKKIWPMLL